MTIENNTLNDLILQHNLWLDHKPNGKELKLNNQQLLETIVLNDTLKYSTYTECTFDKVTFDNSNLSNSIFENCKFNKCNFINCDLSKTIFKSSEFEYTNIYFNNISESNLVECDLILSDFLFNDIDKLNFDKCTFQNSDINYNSYIHSPTGLNECKYISNDTTYKDNIIKNSCLSYEQTLISQKEYAEKMIEHSKHTSEKNNDLIRVEKLLLDKSMLDISAQLKKHNIEHKEEPKKEKSNTKRINQYKSSVTEAIKEHIDLLDYARSQGYTPIKIGNQWSLKEMKDTVRINKSAKNPDRYVFIRHSSGQAGSIIDFEMMIHRCTQDEAIKNLRRLLPSAKQIEYYSSLETPLLNKRLEEEKKELKLPNRCQGQYNRVIAYLTNTRCIDYQIVIDLIKSKHLYEDVKHNAVFVGYDKNSSPAYACTRGTLSEKRFTGEVKNSNKEIGFFINNNSNKFFISEAVIDNLSVATFLKRNGIDYKNFNYLSLGGINTKSIPYHLKGRENIKDCKFYITTDNDKAGAISRHNIKSELLKLGASSNNIFDKIPKNKDFNEDLQKSSQNISRQTAPKFTQANISIAPKTSNKAMTKKVNFEYER